MGKDLRVEPPVVCEANLISPGEHRSLNQVEKTTTGRGAMAGHDRLSGVRNSTFEIPVGL
jgi:hypothetical protein